MKSVSLLTMLLASTLSITTPTVFQESVYPSQVHRAAKTLLILAEHAAGNIPRQPLVLQGVKEAIKADRPALAIRAIYQLDRSLSERGAGPLWLSEFEDVVFRRFPKLGHALQSWKLAEEREVRDGGID